MKKTVITLLFALIALTSQAEQQPQVLHYDQPADYFEEALVIGNGTMGGIVYGGTTCDRISLNDITLWTGEPCNMNIYSPDAHKTIPAVRVITRRQTVYSATCRGIFRRTISRWDSLPLSISIRRRW